MEVTRVRVWSSNQPFEAHADSIRAALFGVLFQLAKDTIRLHTGDLYHDAQWLKNCVTGPMSFYWSVRETGTSIGHDLEFVLKQHGDSGAVYEVRLMVERGAWYVETRKPQEG